MITYGNIGHLTKDLEGLTVLSYGGGQDSTALLIKASKDPEFKRKFIKGRFIVIMSDTGNEHEYTYEHVEWTKRYCKDHGIEFYFITPDLGYHCNTWPSLTDQWKRTKSVGSKAFSKSCTDKLKIVPIYSFLADYVNKNFLHGLSSTKRKKSIRAFADKYGKINVLIGIARNEESRIGNGVERPKWMEYGVDISYPLIEIGFDRKDCQDYILRSGHQVPFPSNCKFCPWLSKVELLWLYRTNPEDFYEWVGYENEKLKKFESKGDKNLGVFGKKRLEEVLELAIQQFGHLTDSELEEYKMSHGHCVKSKY